MLLHMRKNTFILKEASSNVIKILRASRILQALKNCHSSTVVNADKFEENTEFDRPFRRRQNQAPRKFGLGSSYHKNFRVNNFHPKKYDFGPYGRDRSSKQDYESASQSETEKMHTPIEKFYVEHQDVTNRSEDEVENYRTSMSISLKGRNIPKPITKFSELCLPENLMNALHDERYLEPSPIQSQGWPIALGGRDLIGVSQTGSGKTLAYMLPAVVHAANQGTRKVERGECRPQVLVLGPTRELVQQIHKVSQKFIDACDLSAATVYGGASKHVQLSCLRGADICIATPGRLIDFLSGGRVSLAKCSYLVLDEADRMLDMGFEPQIREILDHIRSERQTLMWSATWPPEIRNLAEDFLTDFIHVTIGKGELVANPKIEQKIYVLNENEKVDRIFSLLESIVGEGKNKVLVFAQTKRKVDYLTDVLNREGIKSLGIHGDISQSRRDDVLNTFRRRRSSVLIATDVAARGLDITDINHVVNYDFPPNIEDYIHRIGRTARGSASGVAHSFITDENTSVVKKLLFVLKQTKQEINPDLYTLTEMSKSTFTKFGGYKPFKKRVYR